MNANNVLGLFAPYLFGTVCLMVIVGVVGLIVYSRIRGEGKEVGSEKPKYTYGKKQFLLTRAEHQFYKGLVEAVGGQYFIFAQVHLTDIVSCEASRKNLRAARAHIDRKSVDFLLCDKEYLSPCLAIELDDSTHQRPDRVIRDAEVERVLRMAELPLLRVNYSENISSAELLGRIGEKIISN